MFSIYSNVKIHPPLLLTLLPMTKIWTNSKLHYLKMLLCKFEHFCFILFDKDVKRFIDIFLCKTWFPPIVAQPTPGDHDLNKIFIYNTLGCFHTSASFSGRTNCFWEEDFLKKNNTPTISIILNYLPIKEGMSLYLTEG